MASTFLPPGVVPYLAPDATALGPDLLVHRRGRGQGPRPSCGRSRTGTSATSSTRVPGVAQVASVGGFPDRVPDRRRPEQAPRLRRHPGRGLLGRRPVELLGRRQGDPEGERRVPDPLRRLDREPRRHRDTVVARRENGTPIYVPQLGTVQVGPAFRRSVLEKDGNEAVGGVVLMRYGENPLEVTRRIKEKITTLQAGPARGRADRPVLRPHAADPRGDRDGQRHASREEMIIASLAILLILMHFRSAFVDLPDAAAGDAVRFLLMRHLRHRRRTSCPCRASPSRSASWWTRRS